MQQKHQKQKKIIKYSIAAVYSVYHEAVYSKISIYITK